MYTNRFVKFTATVLVIAAVTLLVQNTVARAGNEPEVDHTFHTPPMSDYTPVDHVFHTPPMSDYTPVDHVFHTPPMSDYSP